MVAPKFFALSKDFTRPKSIPTGPRSSWPSGLRRRFEVTMGLPQHRYVNDADICQAVVGMLARIGVKVNLLAQPKAQYFAKVLKAGWLPDLALFVGLDRRISMDYAQWCCTTSWVATTPNNPPAAEGQSRRLLNKEMDALADRFWSRPTPAKRDQMIKQAFELVIKDYGYIPLHQQALRGASRKK